MSSWQIILLSTFFSLTIGKDPAPDCEGPFSDLGFNYSSFYQGAAHGIHSLSLEEIQHYFKSDAPENNKIPTVNIDFRSEDVIHFSAQRWGYEDRFDSWALKIMDWFMLNEHPYLYETVGIQRKSSSTVILYSLGNYTIRKTVTSVSYA